LPYRVMIRAAVEGIVDEAVVRRLIRQSGAKPDTVFGKQGKDHLLKQLRAYNEAGKRYPWIILMDLDRDDECAPCFRSKYLPHPAPLLCFRIAVREVGAWLLADRKHFAKFLHVPESRMPFKPDELDDPKQTVVDIARRSRSRAIRQDLVPNPLSGRRTGPAYASRLIEFIESIDVGWRPDVASESSDSLRRCVDRLTQLVDAVKQGDA